MGHPNMPRKPSRAHLLLAGVALALGAGCTSYRIVRWRWPGPQNHAAIFPQRRVRRADSSFAFKRAVVPRSDLDTILVRDADGSMCKFSEYAARHRLRAFVVIRNDTILYERYFAGYADSTRSSSFSVAKSVTSMLLGAALERGEVRSLNDTITRYVPELARHPDLATITVRDLLEMKSGLRYTRTTGGLWHDFRSSDAACYYTNNRRELLAAQRRDTTPGAVWSYKDCDTELLGWVLTNAAKQSLAQQLEERVWRRIGTEFEASWDLDHAGDDGLENAAAGVNAALRDYARLGRLYLQGGSWGGAQLIPSAWVRASTTLAPRPEPDVVVWWEMQHQHLWWIPMQNWDAERDFFADGAKGQRIYVHPGTKTIIVQLADDNAQDFPFRRIVHYLAGEPYEYPHGIPGFLFQAAQRGASADSVNALYRTLVADQRRHPERYYIMEAGMIQVGKALAGKAETRAAGIEVLKLSLERSPGSPRSRAALDAVLVQAPGAAHARHP